MGYCQGFEQHTGPEGEISVTGATGVRLNFGIGTALFGCAALAAVGGFRPELRYGEDLDLLLRIREAGVTIEVIPDVTLHYRIHDDSSTHGRTLEELSLLKILKTGLDRQRSKGATGGR
jgi:hypothetical protein